jgi:hypothetical protein
MEKWRFVMFFLLRIAFVTIKRLKEICDYGMGACRMNIHKYGRPRDGECTRMLAFLCFWMLSWPIVEKFVGRNQNMTM